MLKSEYFLVEKFIFEIRILKVDSSSGRDYGLESQELPPEKKNSNSCSYIEIKFVAKFGIDF